MAEHSESSKLDPGIQKLLSFKLPVSTWLILFSLCSGGFAGWSFLGLKFPRGESPDSSAIEQRLKQVETEAAANKKTLEDANVPAMKARIKELEHLQGYDNSDGYYRLRK